MSTDGFKNPRSSGRGEVKTAARINRIVLVLWGVMIAIVLVLLAVATATWIFNDLAPRITP